MKNKTKTPENKKKLVKKPLVKAVAVTKKSSAESYFSPNLYNIATKVEAAEEDLLPAYNEPNVADVRIIAPMSSRLVQEVLLISNMVLIVDTGITLKIPAGYRVCAAANLEYAKRGLFVSHVLLENDRLKLIFNNIGVENPIVIPHKAFCAQIWIEPAYYFDWNK